MQICFESCFIISLYFLLILSDKVTRSCLCRQDLRICVLQITQTTISYPKLLMINYVIILNQFSWFAVLIQACSYLKFADNWLFKRSLQIMQNNTSLPKSLIINYIIILNHFWRVFLMIKTWFYVKIAENWILRHNLLI